jgi:hypothetical protein
MLTRHSALTIIEVLVVLIVLFLLAALCIPRGGTGGMEAVRRNQCSMNARQLARAQEILMINRREAFSGYLEPLRVDDGASSTDGVASTLDRERIVAWPTKLLPVIEQATLHEQIVSGDRTLDLDAPPPIELFNCPSDSLLDLEAGGLAYVVNSGMPDLIKASEGHPSDLRANGLCHDQRPGHFGPRVGFGDVKDGGSVTVLISENIHRDPPGSASQPGNTWLRPSSHGANLEQWYGMVWLVDWQNPRAPQSGLMKRFNRDSRPEDERNHPYAASGTRFARPSSNHPGVFNVAFCGGNAKAIDENIGYAVYQQLMTPNGHKAAPADAPDQPFEKTLPDDQRFMNPPITDADF